MSKSVLITGASRGIGAAAALSFARHGWQVVVNYLRSEEQALAVCRQINAAGGSALPVQADVSRPEQAKTLVETSVAAFGGLDALVCNAGIALPQMLLTDVTDDQWRSLFAADVDGVFYPVRAALPYFVRQKSGSIVTISSMWGQVGGSCEVAYSAAKGAVIAFTKALAKEVGPSGIRVNCVCPGVIQTEMNGHLSSEDLEALRLETPLETLGRPEDVAETVRFLCSEEARFITGQVIGVNGGMVI
ncbi:MAG: 3-oxoacyl-ACP reductase FabG [Candidatus Onthomonas sp.]|nr:3-oxoacyl-ACP reductase FabG [Candidatus Onthomonas sp.]